MLSRYEVLWTEAAASRSHAQCTVHNEAGGIDYSIENGPLKAVKMPLWGNPGGAKFHYADSGAFVEG